MHPCDIRAEHENMKMNVAKGFKRVMSISHKSFHDENLVQIRQILSKNSFPDATITKLIQQVKFQSFSQRKNNETSYPFLDRNSTMVGNEMITFKDLSTTPKPQLPKHALGFAGITYIPGVSDTLKGQLKKTCTISEIGF